jgi:nucleotidyltransferase/DNA polymerase involved in DNA repair
MPPVDRVILLFDLDCFYAQCERVRLGLPLSVSLSLLQWNSVLAVTYPARKCGIQRGDTWYDVAQKSNDACWAIHLPILERTTSTTASATTSTSTTSASTNMMKDDETTQAQEEEDVDVDDDNNNNTASLQEAFDKIYKLSPEEQIKCQQTERGVRRHNHQGKACLERYRIASMRIFAVVLQTLQDRLEKNQHSFTLERASIDEFYLDITNYCHDNTTKTDATIPSDTTGPHNTIEIGSSSESSAASLPHFDPTHHALQKACIVSHWIRTSVWEILGFTMSAGISTNKMMAKLSASYGKPNGQAMLHPLDFNHVLNETPLNKVRHFGGKLGKQVERMVGVGPKASMGSIQQISLPTLQQSLGGGSGGGAAAGLDTTAQFVFDSCRGIDREVVKETMGALVKSITAFKSFPATCDTTDIQNWLQLLATEVVSRVGTDAGRNHRYPKSCTLQYSYTITTTTTPTTGTHADHGSLRSSSSSSTTTTTMRQSKSQRLLYPYVSHPSKVPFLITQAMEKLATIPHPLRGVGLSVGNFEERGTGSGGASIQSLFTKQRQQSEQVTTWTESSSKDDSLLTTNTMKRRSYQQPKKHPFVKNPLTESKAAESSEHLPPSSDQNHPSPGQTMKNLQPTFVENSNRIHDADDSALTKNVHHTSTTTTVVVTSEQDKDLELAKTLQASFDRENYILSTAEKGPIRKKVRRIEAFFQKR